MVPAVVIETDRMIVQAEGHDAIDLNATDWSGLTEALVDLARSHETRGRVIMVPSSDVPHGDLIAAMDAAREPFPWVVLAGGVQ